jgi:hypothetical protein
MVVGKLEIKLKEIQKKNVDLVFLIVILFDAFEARKKY